MKGLYRFNNSRVWWFRWTEGGKRYAISLKTDDEAVAIGKARAILAEGLSSPHSQTGIEHAISQYLREAQERPKKPLRPETAKRRRYILQSFATENGIEFVGQITHKVIESWVASRSGSADTRHTYAHALRIFIASLVDRKLVRRELLDQIDVPEPGVAGRKNWLKNKEVARVIGESHNDDLTFGSNDLKVR
jgi:hypothetical protein